MITLAALAPFLLALKISLPSGQEVSVGMGPLKIIAEVRTGEIARGEVCIVSWEGSSCFPIGFGFPRVNTRKYELREDSCFGAILSYWDPKGSKWIKVESPPKCVEVK
jgi:hypothetical protein